MKKFDVAAIGELNPDIILTGVASMPIPGRELMAKTYDAVLGSSTAICASAMSGLGLRTLFLGGLGKDLYGDLVLNYLNEYEIDTSYIMRDEAIKTGVTLSIVSEGDRALVTYPGGSIDGLCAKDIDEDIYKSVRHIHVGSFFLQKNLRSDLAEIFKKANAHGVTTSLDAGWDDTENWDYGIREVLEYTDIFLPNLSEAMAISGCDHLEGAAAKLAEKARIVVVKCGGDGAYLVSGNNRLVKKPYRVDVVDTTGAGDNFNGGFIYGFLNGFSMEHCLEFGNAAAGISVTKIGGASARPTLEEVRSLIGGRSLPHKPEGFCTR